MKPLRINETTRISELIKANPLVIETLAEFNPHFNKLKNPILRNLLAKRVSILDACRIGGCKPAEFLDKMASIGFEIESSETSMSDVGRGSLEVPDLMAVRKVIELDVRPVLAKGDDPLKLILKISKDLKPDECLKVINTFEPTPLISLLGKQGYKSWTERPAEDLVFTWFVKSETSSIKHGILAGDQVYLENEDEFQRMVKSFSPDRLHTIDVRNLAMPLPMLTILEYLLKLKQDEALFVYHKKVPVYLLPELKERGFKYFIQDSTEGRINMLICK